MTNVERLDERLTAVERAVVDGDFELDELADLASMAEDIEQIESRLDDVEERLADFEARAQAVEGFVGNVRSVNEDVEQQADAALATVDRLEERVQELEAMVGVKPTRDPQRDGRRAGGRGPDGPEGAEQTVDRIVADDRRTQGPGTGAGDQGNVPAQQGGAGPRTNGAPRNAQPARQSQSAQQGQPAQQGGAPTLQESGPAGGQGDAGDGPGVPDGSAGQSIDESFDDEDDDSGGILASLRSLLP